VTEVIYDIVQHDGGWAYKVGDSFSETFPTHEAARVAATKAAVEHEKRGEPETIEYEDSDSRWHNEETSGDDRPTTTIRDRD
jgi:hypothetical protein